MILKYSKFHEGFSFILCEWFTKHIGYTDHGESFYGSNDFQFMKIEASHNYLADELLKKKFSFLYEWHPKHKYYITFDEIVLLKGKH